MTEKAVRVGKARIQCRLRRTVCDIFLDAVQDAPFVLQSDESGSHARVPVFANNNVRFF